MGDNREIEEQSYYTSANESVPLNGTHGQMNVE